jgi:predicted dehydrogenase/threonine dehydrogenase-like Zn-dependent dehydrogenase
MKQVLQVLGTGDIRVLDVPPPQVRPGGVLVRTAASVISVGTDRSQLEFGRKSLMAKARERPQQVGQILQSVARDGLRATRERVRRKLESYVALGYSCAGYVEQVGAGISELREGMHVACAGAGYASHAELVWVPRNLVVPVPAGVPSEHAAFATMGAIALHGIRQTGPALGEVVAVIGLGLIGQLTVQLLIAAGVDVLAVDVDPLRVEMATGFGAVGIRRADPVELAVAAATQGLGVDAVIITAGTSSNDPIKLAGRITRDRGRVVMVGVSPMDVPRSPFYEKEIELRFSRSYGPGRYDPSFEEKGIDYPPGYVRWTERANLAEFLRLVAKRHVLIEPLISARHQVDDANSAYAPLERGGAHQPLGVVLTYPRSETPPARSTAIGISEPQRNGDGIGFIGAGSFATDTLLPGLRRLRANLVAVSTARGVTALQATEQFGFRYAANSPEELLSDETVGIVFIATRHHDHARWAEQALRAGRAVFVEKPLALDETSLQAVLEAAAGAPQLMVGFNRRFAPATKFVMERLARLPGARVVQVRVSAGSLPVDAWLHDPDVGGGRLIGEACHFIDLARHLVGAPIRHVQIMPLDGPDPASRLNDNFIVSLSFGDGSIASIVYTSKGSTTAGKERVEVFAAGTTSIIDDFRTAAFYSDKVERWRGRQDKGHFEQLRCFLAAVRQGDPSPIPLEQLAEVSEATLLAAAALRGPHATACSPPTGSEPGS